MIYEDIRDILKNITDSDELDLFDQASVVLEDYNATDYLVAFDMAIGQWATGDTDNETRLDSLRTVVNTCIDYICQIQGVVLVEDLLLSEKITIARALLDLVNYEDGQSILDRLAIECSDEETFAELVSMVTPLGVDSLMAMVESIAPGFSKQLKEIIDGRKETLVEDAESVKPQIEAYVQLKTATDNKPLFADMFFAQLGSIGLPLEVYMNAYKQKINDFDVRPMSQTAEDLLSLAIVSGDGCATPLLALHTYVLQLYTDSNKQMQLSQAIKALIDKVSVATKVGVK